jgi:UDP-perosamine 4-acetyltransferase
MLVIGAGGLATQIFDDLVYMNEENAVFWSEVETSYPFIRDIYDIIDNDEAVKAHFKTVSRDFVLCVSIHNGNRRKLAEKFIQLGGEPSSFISPRSYISKHGTIFEPGVTILSHAIFEPNCHIGEGTLINKTANAGHGCRIGKYCELSPGVMLMGDVTIGDDTFIGPGAIVQARVNIGKNCLIAAGCVIRKDIPDNSLVVTEPVKIVKQKES